jgi:DNA-binding NtrC family response regulator
MALLERYRWPGNIRELRNNVERAAVIAHGSLITVEDLPERIRSLAGPGPEDATDAATAELPDEVNLRAELQRHEAELIRAALAATEGKREEAARRLGIPVRTLYAKLQAHGIR